MKARLKKELGQTGGFVSVLGRYLLPKRHHGLVCSAQAWIQGMPELYSETWQLGLLAHCGLLASDSPAAGQKLSIQLIQQQILKKSFNRLGWEGDSTADLPPGSLPALPLRENPLCCTSLLAGVCQEAFGGPWSWVQ